MPAEIAVSIMAEIVQEKNRHFRTYCDEAVEAQYAVGHQEPWSRSSRRKDPHQEEPGARCSYSGTEARQEASAAEKWSLKPENTQ